MESLMVGVILKKKQDQLNSLSPEMTCERERIQKEMSQIQERYAETFENYRSFLSPKVIESSPLYCLHGINA